MITGMSKMVKLSDKCCRCAKFLLQNKLNGTLIPDDIQQKQPDSHKRLD